jgi:hypothetical protein
MAWISVVAARNDFITSVSEHCAARAKDGIVAFDSGNLVWAWLAGSPAAKGEEESILMRPTHLTSRMVERPSETLLLSLAGSLLLRRCLGENVDADLARLAKLKGYKETSSLVVQATLNRIVSDTTFSTKRVGKIGYPETNRDFKKLVEGTAPPIPAQIALVPDGSLWSRTCTGTVIPLAYEALSASGKRPDLSRLSEFVHCGGDPRKRDVVYQRVGQASSSVWREDPTEVPGFDAVELTEDAVIVHHYMGVRWQAPLLLDEDVNAFQFLAHVDAGWDQVRDTLGADGWQRLQKVRATHRTVHRVSIDIENATDDPASTAQASKTYGVEIEVVSFLDA